MKFTLDKHDKYCIFTLEEEKLNSVIAPLVKSEMIVLNAEGVKNIIFDTSRVRFVDSSGLSSILIANRLCKNSGGNLVLCSVSDNVHKLIKISQLDSILTIIPSKEESIDMVMMEEIEKDIKKS
ncbi:MAG: STAS domain-containing protein [Bacteroidota bacterium]|jgi:anti-anti-sigma factor|nr:STAS domain-containing protein [Bacteroidota bacterium]GDX47333.1 anti-sigma factor antagonist [Bacteroidota bacterium]